MKFFLLIIVILSFTHCSKPKTVLICGDHVCVNKAEAEQYFQENLSIEVKVIDKKINNEIDLVELNLKENQNGKKKISILSKNDTKKDLKVLSSEEKTKIKKKIKKKSKEKKNTKKENKKEKKIVSKTNNINQEEYRLTKVKINKKRNDVADVCSILEKCSIDEISKYLLKQGEKRGFPDITTRQ